MVKAKKYILANNFNGMPKKSDLKVIEEELPPIREGEFLCRAEYLSVDPYMRIFMEKYPAESPMIGTQVARIIESKNIMFPVDKLVVGNYGWRDYTIDGKKSKKLHNLFVPTHILPELGNLPPSLAIGILGMPGNAGYFGLSEVCKPQPGELVVVSGAAGAVGSIVGQIAKIKGCTVIGFAGSEEKCNWLRTELQFDYCFNYKTADVAGVLREIATNGIDCYFDNVGGELSMNILSQMRPNGRVLICGSISQYNEDPQNVQEVSELYRGQLKIEHFSVMDWTSRWMEGIEQLKKWIDDGKIKYKEHITHGFENMFDAFLEDLPNSKFLEQL